MLILNIYHPVTPLYAVAESTKQKQNKKLYGLLMKSLTLVQPMNDTTIHAGLYIAFVGVFETQYPAYSLYTVAA